MGDMNIETVKQKLKDTISGKEKLLQALESSADKTSNGTERLVFETTAQFLEINLTELRNILEHIEAIDND